MKYKIAAGLILVIVILGSIGIGWSIGHDDQAGHHLQIAALQAEIVELENELAVARLPEYEEPDEYEWLKPLLDNIQSANITWEYKQDGYNKGIISIYWERGNKRDVYLPEQIEESSWYRIIDDCD